MTRLYWTFSALTIFALVAVAIWFFTAFRPVQREIRLPPKGEALYNPLYALQRSLNEYGIDAHSRAQLDFEQMALRAGDNVLLYSDPRHLSVAQTEALLNWTEQGGHLIVAMPADDSGGAPLLLRQLGVQVFGEATACESLRVDRSDKPVPMLCQGSRFDLPQGASIAWGDAERGYAYARLRRGQGTVDLFSELDFLDNKRLEKSANWRLAYQALAPDLPHGRVFLIYASTVPSLWLLIVRDGWPVLLGLALMLAAWMTMRGQRFGPLSPPPVPDRRALLEHLHAAGEHAYRRGAASALHRALREWVLTRLRRRDPMAFALDGQARVLHLATRLALDPARIRQALQPPAKLHAASFCEAMATLIQLGSRL